MTDKVIDSLANTEVQSYDKEVIYHTAVLYRAYVKPSVDNYPRLRLGQLPTLGLDIGPLWKQPCDNL